MEHHREQLYITLLPHIEKKDRQPIEKFMPLPWDKNYKKHAQSSKPKTAAEVAKFWEDLDKREAAAKELKTDN